LFGFQAKPRHENLRSSSMKRRHEKTLMPHLDQRDEMGDHERCAVLGGGGRRGIRQASVIADVTGDFRLARLQRTSEKEKTGYPPRALELWAKRARSWAAAPRPMILPPSRRPCRKQGKRDVFIYMISGAKVARPRRRWR